MFYKRIYRLIVISLALVIAFAVMSNLWVVSSGNGKIFRDAEDVPAHKVALVLGTSKKLIGGQPNPFFYNRIQAAAELYKKGKVKHFILSGDNSTKYYNEPVDMKNALIEMGVPDSIITLDYAGLRTLDSVVRCKEIFGQKEVIIVTQKFHSYRALFISNFYDLDASVYSARRVPVQNSLKVRFREFLARPKAVIDVYLIDKKPKYLGKKEKIVIS
jgi:SanA protein